MIYPASLFDKLTGILSAPLSLVSAESGYGKTTAVSGFLEQRLADKTSSHWYTCFGEQPERVWEGICALLTFADELAAQHLSKFELPTVDNLGHISLLMDGLSCERETVLIIDNYQLARFPAPYRLLDAMASHRCANLHIVVLTHPIQTGELLSTTHPKIYSIHQEAFRFYAHDVHKLFALWDEKLSVEQAHQLSRITEGWIAALRLYLAQYLTDGTLSEAVGMDELIEQAFWRRLNGEQQEFFMGLSLLDTFTEAQAAVILDRPQNLEALWLSVRENAFVYKVESGYTLHSLLRDYLSMKFLAQPEIFCALMRKRAGNVCQMQGKNVEAVRFFIQAGEDAAALSVPLTSLQIAEMVRTRTAELEGLLARCPTGLLAGHWRLLLGTSVKASLNGKLSLARTAIHQLTELRVLFAGETLGSFVSAALELIASFQSFNDISEMCRHHKAICELLNDPRGFYWTNDSWTFGVPSVLYMYWREDRSLKETSGLLTEGIPRYALLSDGKGSGAPEAMQAEMLLLSGNEADAEKMAHRASFIAREHGEDSIYFCALTIMARLAVLRGDSAAFSQAVDHIRRHAFEGREFGCVTASELALGFLYSRLDMEDSIPQWLFQSGHIRQTLYSVSVPFAQIITLRWLRRHKPEDLGGAVEAFGRESTKTHHLLPLLYGWLEEAVLYEQSGSRAAARERIGQVLSYALPNKAYLPIAEYYGELSGLLNDPELSCPDPAALEKVKELGRRFSNGERIVRAVLLGNSPLTGREREMALLAKGRLTTEEIAQRLSISPATVKNTLNKVYSKLNIRGKKELLNTPF